jgi:hypothetical protein
MTDQTTAPTNEAAPTVADTTRPTPHLPASREGLPGAVPYSRFKAVNDGLRTLQAQLPDLQAKAAKTDELQQQIAGLELQLHAQDVARDYGLPVEYQRYIQGDSKADIAAKAAGLVAAIPGLGQTPPPAFTPGEVSDKGWYSRNRARVLRTMGLDG